MGVHRALSCWIKMMAAHQCSVLVFLEPVVLCRYVFAVCRCAEELTFVPQASFLQVLSSRILSRCYSSACYRGHSSEQVGVARQPGCCSPSEQKLRLWEASRRIPNCLGTMLHTFLCPDMMMSVSPVGLASLTCFIRVPQSPQLYGDNFDVWFWQVDLFPFQCTDSDNPVPITHQATIQLIRYEFQALDKIGVAHDHDMLYIYICATNLYWRWR